MARLSILVALLCLLAIGVWGMMRPAGPAGEPPSPQAARAEPGSGVSLETAALTDLEVAIDVTVRGLILPATPSRSFRLARGTMEVPAVATVLTPLDGPALVEFALPDGETLYRVLRPDDPDTVRLLDTELRGRVVDTDGGPVSGAAVWYGQGHPDRSDSVTTDAEGAFAVPWMPGGRGIPIVVRAEGLTSSYRVMDLDGSAQEPVFVLEPAVTLSVQLAADIVDPSRARVFLAPADEGDSRLQRFPFFLAALSEDWRVEAAGTARVAGLPAGTRVEVIVHHPLALSQRTEPVLLHAGSEVVVPLRRRAAWRGRVMDPQGQPLAGVAVESLTRGPESPSRHSPRWLLPAAVDAIGVAAVTTDDQGMFTVGRCELLRVTATGRAGLEVRPEPDEPLELTLFEAQSGEPGLRIVVPGCDGSYRIRCRPFRNDWRTMPCGEAFTQTLPEAVLVDVRVQIRDGGVVREPRVFMGLPVQGLTDVDLR